MSVNCIRCVRNMRTGSDLLCDTCRFEREKNPQQLYPAGSLVLVWTGAFAVATGVPDRKNAIGVVCRVDHWSEYGKAYVRRDGEKTGMYVPAAAILGPYDPAAVRPAGEAARR